MTAEDTRLPALKRELRRRYAAARDGLPPVERERRSALASGHARDWLRAQGARSLLAYAPFRSELDCGLLIEQAWQDGVTVVLPRALPGGKLALYSVRSWRETAPGAFGIPEPLPGVAETWPAGSGLPEAALVPGLAFDRRGGRLGYGQGYYDRLLAVSAERGGTLWAGLAFELQMDREVPAEPHDAFMDYVITEQGIYDCRKRRKA